VARRKDAGNTNIFKALQHSHGETSANPKDGIVASSQRRGSLANSQLLPAQTKPLIFRDNPASGAGFMGLRPKKTRASGKKTTEYLVGETRCLEIVT